MSHISYDKMINFKCLSIISFIYVKIKLYSCVPRWIRCANVCKILRAIHITPIALWNSMLWSSARNFDKGVALSFVKR